MGFERIEGPWRIGISRTPRFAKVMYQAFARFIGSSPMLRGGLGYDLELQSHPLTLLDVLLSFQLC